MHFKIEGAEIGVTETEPESELAIIFTPDLGMTRDEMIVLETFLLDIIDLALGAGKSALALETEDALLDLHALKRSQLPSGGSVLAFWEQQFSQIES